MMTLLLIVDEKSGRILAAALIPRCCAEHEFNRLIDHFQFGATDWDILTSVDQTYAIRLTKTVSHSPV